MKLKKRIIFSRHNLRYPLFFIEEIEQKLNKKFINWSYSEEQKGLLTEKGQLLELKFGQDLSKIYKDKIEYVFTNTMQRTYLTAKSFLLGYQAFEDTKINMIYNDFSKLDYQFSLCLNSEDIIDKEKVAMVDKKLANVYKKMEEIIGLQEGYISKDKTRLFIDEVGYLHVRGALKIATDICDLFILMYYENFDKSKIFKSDNFIEDLKLMSKAKDAFLDLLFGNKVFLDNSKINVLSLLNKYINSEYSNILIVGHDSNLSAIMKKFNIDYKMKDNMIEKYPIAAKLIIEIFENNEIDIYYSYYDYETIRNFKNSKPIIEHLYKGKL